MGSTLLTASALLGIVSPSNDIMSVSNDFRLLYYYFFDAMPFLMAFTTPSLPASRIERSMPFFS